MTLTILICTHNRAALLEQTLASLNAALRPAMAVQILVAANACTDDTIGCLRAYQARQEAMGWLPLRFLEVPIPGKSHALNAAILEIDTELTAFVDDDHRVDPGYLRAIEEAARAWPLAGLYCGRILPDWDGREPAWVHDEGPYRIYPLPVPRYDQGEQPKTITAEEGPIPGGGNLVVRREVFAIAGRFSTELGPHGHDLGGGEDSEFVLRAMARGVRCQYVPAMVQYHHVDVARFRLGYLMRKAYQRSRSTARIRGNGRVPLYMWRKVGEYAYHSVFSLSWARRRFFLVRTAAALGEVHGRRESGHFGSGLRLPVDHGLRGAWLLAATVVVSAAVALISGGNSILPMLLAPAAWVAIAASLLLLAKSVLDFSQTGPRLRQEILRRYRFYTLYALARLSLWAFALMLFTGCIGAFSYLLVITAVGAKGSMPGAVLAAALGILGALAFQFVRKLRFNPGLLVASMHYRMSRLYPLWEWMTPGRIMTLKVGGLGLFAVLLVAASWRLVQGGRMQDLAAFWAIAAFLASTVAWASWEPDARPPRRIPPRRTARPNLLLIGSDTLRADRLGALGYPRLLTPHLDRLAETGTLFANCYVPCARTAPSLVSLLTGTWPHTHGIRDNFVADDETKLAVDALPQLLRAQGYRTVAISDWCGADMGKLSFGFQHTELPKDQWNLKYLIRQGPKDLRLFLSLFLHNRLGRLLLPEIYYLGGVPLTRPLGRRARRLVSRLAATGEPFFLNVFYSTTHPPFASEWPWYTRFADPAYRGPSKFAMARLADPFDIIRRQGAPKEEFDLDQIIDLYDACVAEFDDEVGRMLQHLEACGLAENTIVVVYSDHGMEFFEHDTWGQGNSAVGEASPRVPLVIRDPRTPGRGRVEEVVRSIDLAPTLLEMVDLAPTPTMEGVSLAPFLRGDEAIPTLDAFNETGIWITEIPGLPAGHLRYPDLFELLDVPDPSSGTLAIKRQYRDTIIRAKDRMIRHGQWKLVYQPLSEGFLLRLYDLSSDPACQWDVAAQHPDITEALWARLAAWMGPEGVGHPHPDRSDTRDSSSSPA